MNYRSTAYRMYGGGTTVRRYNWQNTVEWERPLNT